MSKVHFGGTPTGIDVRKLREAFGEPPPGTDIPHEEVEAALGIDRHSTRYRTVTNAWRKEMLKDHNIAIGAVPNKGFRSLDSGERISGAFAGVNSGTRKIMRSVRSSEHVRTDDPVLGKKQELLRNYGIAVAKEQGAMRKQIEPPKPAQILPRRVA